MKHEWRKHEKELYTPKEVPVELKVPKLKFITMTGEGNPNDAPFAAKIEVLYALSYGVRMAPKNGFEIPGYFEYTVYPLEGVWDSSEEVIDGNLDKDKLIYKIMIRQPDFLTPTLFDAIAKAVSQKKPALAISDVKFEEIADGECIQIMHTGSYDSESESFAKMQTYAEAANLERIGHAHREIYLSDFRKTEAEKLKTILRYFVKPSNQ